MHFWEGALLALVQIRTQKLKSFFSVLGVIVGVMFLLVVVSVVEGMDRYIREDFSQQVYGLNTVTVRRRPAVQIQTTPEIRREWARRPRLTYADADALRTRIALPVLVGTESSTFGELRQEDGRRVENVIITGASEELLRIRALNVEQGRAFSPQEAERGAPVVVLGRSTAEALFPGLDPLGRTVRIAGFPYRVIGVLEEQGSLLGMSRDNRALAPARSPVRRLRQERNTVDAIVIQARDPSQLPAALLEAEAVMRVQHRLRPAEPNSFELETAEASLGFWDRISRILFVALPGLVAISLVVGGIVIMNIMLVSVLERTREIGVRKAIGARRRDIVVQVLIESATLSGVGALMGVGIGILLTWVVRGVSPLPAAIAPQWVALGLLLGIVVGMAAGVYPAARAARLDPVEALRYE